MTFDMMMINSLMVSCARHSLHLAAVVVVFQLANRCDAQSLRSALELTDVLLVCVHSKS